MEGGSSLIVEPRPKPCPMDTCNPLSHILYSWVTEFIRWGWRNEITMDKFYAVSAWDEATKQTNDFLINWEKEKATAMKKGREPQILRALWHTYWKLIVFSGFQGIVESILRLITTIYLGKLTGYFRPNTNVTTQDALIYAGAITIASAGITILHHQFFFYIMRLGMQIRTAMMGAVYRKTVSLSTEALGQTTTGHVINLMSSDVQRFDNVCVTFHFLWLAPLELIVIIFLVWEKVGVSCLAGFSVLLLMVPMQGYAGKFFGVLRRKATNLTDERVKKMNEVITGMRVMKMYAWEDAFLKLIASIRGDEVSKIRTASYMRAVNLSFYFVSPALIALFTFGTYQLTGGVLEADKVFMTIALFNITRLNMTLFVPLAVQGVAETLVALKRLQHFLMMGNVESQYLADLLKHQNDHSQNGATSGEGKRDFGSTGSVYVQSVTCVWEMSEAAAREKQRKSNKGVERSMRALGKRMSAPMRQSFRSLSMMRRRTFRRPAIPVDEPVGPHMASEHPAIDENIDPATVLPEDKEDEATKGAHTVRITALSNVDFSVGPASLLAVVGPVGAGKSTLLMTLLKELTPTAGSVTVTGRVSYASQEPWIVSGSVRDNILFGLPFEEQRYNEVVAVCCLQRDFALFPDGDMTELGERGINLSGGQKARISLARAAYFDADVYLLDDPLSAVDAHVGRRLFEDCICGYLKDKCRILVTHQLQYLPRCDNILVLQNGRQAGLGTYESLQASGHDLSVLLHTNEDEDDVEDETNEVEKKEVKTEEREVGKKVVEGDGIEESGDGNVVDVDGADMPLAAKSVTELVKAETKKEGQVDYRVYISYFNAAGGYSTIIVMSFFFTIGQAALLISDWWLSYWANPNHAANHENSSIAIYAGIVVALIVMSKFRAIYFFNKTLDSSRNLHNTMFEKVMRSPISFFDANPVGRILNRFSKDIALMDDNLPVTFFDYMQSLFMTAGAVLLVAIINPWVFLVVLPCIIAFILLRRLFVKTSREVKRFEGMTRSPIFSHFSASLQGLTVIRAYGATQRFVESFHRYQNIHTQVWFMFLTTSRWLGVRLDALSVVLTVAVAFGSIPVASSLNPGLVGLSLAYVLQLQGNFQWAVRQSVETENLMTSVERVLEYTELPSEAPPITDTPLPEGWPVAGAVEFDNLTLRYRPGAKPVLDRISVSIRSGEKVGIVGRTGAGKSSLMVALFRLTEYEPPGKILIDGIPTNALGTKTLRQSISVIPQEPVLFSGSVRSNLDPFNQHDDQALWTALEDVQLKDLVTSLGRGLEANLSEAGCNLSVGQRQLMCLARAILMHNKILVMDEATANVDLTTDGLIQATIRQKFADCTVLTIAHRINTILDSDKIMVMDSGQLVEFDTPAALLRNLNGYFRGLYDETQRMHSHALTSTSQSVLGDISEI
eukprot:comp23635_c0_seq1/m.40294 comp23635_c0_seq1/g.40294  ORF comp23635_c0_seq1/g.40294 comp23635_c0_seq1/m.40294 type:complete len:1411 (-) comp23635_c0_seq1:61-4293(-)